MSANRDRNQRVTFVYSNFYQLYKKGKDAALGEPAAGQTSAVLKTGDRREIENYQPITLIARKAHAAAPRVTERPSALPPSRPPQLAVAPVAKLATAPVTPPEAQAADSRGYQNSAIDSLKENLRTLNELHSRLNFMLKELEELVRD